MIILEDNKAQGSAEIILLLGAMVIIVLVVLNIYKNYLRDISLDISDNEVNKFNSELSQMEDYFNF